jgi:uncharacterized protein (DUF362 family)
VIRPANPAPASPAFPPPAVVSPKRVICVRAPATEYGSAHAEVAPELPGGRAIGTAAVAVRALLRHAGLDAARYGSEAWNPLAEVVPEGGRVLLKPNWVTHQNHSGEGMDCLVTHTSVVEAIARYVVRARPARVVIGDAPIQGCDFELLREHLELDAMMTRLWPEAERQGVRLDLLDLRRRVLPGGSLENQPAPLRRADADYVLFDLGKASDLEPVTREGTQFRVTMYDPDALQRTHAPGRHQYLIAREAIEADVVFNLPKLKTHKKAGVTGALKNMVGINGHKEYLPHHRKGGEARGDCYPGRSLLKALVEELSDRANRTTSRTLRYLVPRVSWVALRFGALLGDDRNVEGSWHGNDTVWRMCLDLQRILHFGRADGSMAALPQRRVITLTDAIVCGQGEGPLSPSPAPLGLLTLGSSPAALEWVHAILLRMDPTRVPLVRQAFAPHRYPLVDFGPEDIEIEVDGEALGLDAFVERYSYPARPPAGWAGHCELVAAPSPEVVC